MVFDKKAVAQFPVDQVVAMALVRDLVTDHQDKVADLLRRHEELMDQDPQVNIMKLAALSQERGRYFDEDFEEMGEKAHYFDIKGIIDKVKGVVQEGKKTFVNAYAPGMGDKAVANEERSKGFIKGLLGKIFNKNGNTGDLNNNPNAKKLKDAITGDDDDKKSDLILGMKKSLFWGGIAVIVILFIVVLVVIKMNKMNKQKQVAAKAAA